MAGVSDAPVIVTGEGRILPGSDRAGPVRFELRSADFTATVAGTAIAATYRDVNTIGVDQSRVLLDIGGTRLLAERLGASLGTLVGTLRDRRARQQLTDRLIDLPEAEAIGLVEYQAADEHGVAQLAYHPWGVALIPLDERLSWRLLRRADVARVTADQGRGRVTVEVSSRPSAPDARPIDLLGLGAAAERERKRLAGLRESALADAAAIVGQLIPSAPVADRSRAESLLVDGHPTTPDELGTAWTRLEPAVLADPTYAASYVGLRGRAHGGQTWISLAPTKPTDPTAHMAWFFVALPRDLLAFELVSEGSHATYLFRADGSAETAVYEISESLIDTRFLREPIYMTEAELNDPTNLHYRFAIAALPSLRAARARFVRRLIHTDDESWAETLDNAIANHETGGA